MGRLRKTPNTISSPKKTHNQLAEILFNDSPRPRAANSTSEINVKPKITVQIGVRALKCKAVNMSP